MASLRCITLDLLGGSMLALTYVCLSLHLTCVGAVAGGPCLLPPIAVRVSQPSDVALRLNYPRTTAVALQFDTNLTVASSILLNDSFTCTILEPCGSQPVWITSVDDSVVPLRVEMTSNVVVRNLHFRLPFLNAAGSSTAPCPDMKDWLKEWVCPAVMIYGSWGIQFTGNEVDGRVDVFRGANSLFDSNRIYTPVRSKVICPATIRVYYSGDPVNIIPANITISNNDISGNEFGVGLAHQTVGVTLANNFIHNFTSFGVACGANIHDIADCFLNTMPNNLVVVEPELQPYFSNDGAGFYFDTHWANPGNELSCNYVYGGVHCYYLDYCSSDVHVKGGVCVGVSEVVKLNTGKQNVVESVVVTAQSRPAFISCQNYFENNCDIGEPSRWWLKTLAEKYWSPAWEKQAPYLVDFCNQTSFEWGGKVWECNPEVNPVDPSIPVHGPEISRRCSGLPTGNNLSSVVIDFPKGTSVYLCNASTPTVPNMNSMADYHFNHSQVMFGNYEGLDWAVLSGSPVYDEIPDFHSCPVGDVGIQPKKADAVEEDVWNRFNAGVHVQEMLGRDFGPLYSLSAEDSVPREEVGNVDAYRNAQPELEKGLADLIARQVENLAARMKYKEPLVTKIARGGYSSEQANM